MSNDFTNDQFELAKKIGHYFSGLYPNEKIKVAPIAKVIAQYEQAQHCHTRLEISRKVAEDVVQSLIQNGFIVLSDNSNEKLGEREGATQLAIPHIAHALKTANDEACRVIREHVDECNDQMSAGEDVPDFTGLRVWLRKYAK